MDNKLWLGTRRYSSWSLRGWLAVKLAGLEVEEICLPIAGTGKSFAPGLLPANQVPVLAHNGNLIWESLAIAEYCAEQKPGLWPADAHARAHARAIAAEMHAGFRALRQAMPMNLGRPDFAGRGRTLECLADIIRIEALFMQTRTEFAGSGPYLFGADFNLADAMYAPVVARLLTYAPDLTDATRAYCAAVRAHPLVAQWYDLAAAEPASWLIEKYEAIA